MQAIDFGRGCPIVRVVALQNYAEKVRQAPSDLDFLLRNQRIETVVLNGGFTDCCVLNTAFDANNHNYRVIVLRDLVRGTDPHLESVALSMVSLHLGLVMDSQDLLQVWGRNLARAQ